MPFKSEKQRRYLHANHPEIAKRWEKDYANGGITLPKGPAGITSLNGWGSTDESQNVAGVDISPSMDRNPNDSGWGGGGKDGPKGPPSVINPPKGPTKEEIEAAKQKQLLAEQQRQAQQYSDFYDKFKGDTKKKTEYLSRLLKNDPLYETYKDKGLLDWSNIKSFDQDKLKTAEEIEKAKQSAWGYTRPWTSDESLYIADINKFDPTWTPGWTGDSKQERLNKRIANTIGHEARHQVLGEGEGAPWGWQGQTMWTGDPYSQKVEIDLTQDENSPYSKYMDEGGLEYQGYSTPMTSHELLTRMGDFQSQNNPRIYEDIYGNVHGWMPRHLTSDVANKFYDAAEQFTKDTKARTAGEKYEYIDPIMIEGVANKLMEEYSEDTEELPRSEVVRILKQEADQLGTKDFMDILKEDYKYDQDENFKKGGVARKKYSTGGVLDITGEEEITTEEGNDISLVDETETGVSTLFKEKNNDYAVQGGVKNYLGEQEMVSAPKHWQSAPDHPKTELTYITDAEKDLLVKADLHGSLHGSVNKGPQGLASLNGWGDADDGFGGNEDKGETSSDSGWSPGAGSPGTTSTGGNVNTGGGDGYQDRIIEIQERNRQKDLKNLIETGPGSDVEKYDTDLVGMTEAEKYNARRNMIKNKYTATSPQRKNALTVNYNQEKERLEKAMKGNFLKTLAFAAIGVPPGIGNIVSLNPFGEKKLTGLGPQAYELQQLKNQYIADLTSMKDDLLAGVDTTNPNEMKNLEETTNFTEIVNELEELTKTKDEDEDTGGEGPEVPVVAPVTEEIGDSYAMVGDWMSRIRGDRWKVAYLDKLERQAAELQENRDFQENTMFLNSGGLANLFRVKN